MDKKKIDAINTLSNAAGGCGCAILLLLALALFAGGMFK